MFYVMFFSSANFFSQLFLLSSSVVVLSSFELSTNHLKSSLQIISVSQLLLIYFVSSLADIGEVK